MEALLNVVENVAGDYTKADAAEQYVYVKWVTMPCIVGPILLLTKRQSKFGNSNQSFTATVKKVCWHTTFGEISVMEPLFRRPGQQFRPFITSENITSRCCSMPLQRVMTDFGADHAFGQVPKKLHEHYGIDMPVSTVRKITEYHGQHMQQQRETMT